MLAHHFFVIIPDDASNASRGNGFWPPDSFAPAKPVPVLKIAQRSANSSPYEGDELFSLILPRFPCYEYSMAIIHRCYPSLSPSRSTSLRQPNLASCRNLFFDGTNPPIVVGLTKTTSNSMSAHFR
jgi:hypothetical protein